MEVIDRISLIQKRDNERKLDLQKRKENKSNLAADNEKLTVFQETFDHKRVEIETKILESKNTDKINLPDYFNEISKEILQLQKYVANSNIFLRTYDIKKCQENIQDLTNKLKELENELLPKKKFGFKNKKAKEIEKKVESKDEIDFQNKPNFIVNFCGFSNKIGECLILKRDEVNKKDVTIEKLENCKVQIFGSPSTLHLSYLKNCYIFTGPVSTSIFAENCIDCTLVIACQQLRLHASRNVNIYLHVTSRAIMEDCTEIFVAPYNLNYEGIDKDFEVSGLNKQTNNWKCIDDFNWLNVEQQSPHWALLDKEKIVNSWDIFNN